ncbi:unnamed protein product [marine sediment metagenome]|uniref:Uncharacterized protein n=1 Tax=marine sediment metagenome TaxID=412755 RepID=X1G4X4_9ZZZZ
MGFNHGRGFATLSNGGNIWGFGSPPPELLVEEQVQHDKYTGLSGEATGKRWAGQRFLVPPNRKIATLAFIISQVGNPIGEVTFTIREYPTNIPLLSKVWGDASDLPAVYPPTEWQEVEFDAPLLIDVLVEMIVQFNRENEEGQVGFAFQEGDIKPDEEYIRDVEGSDPTAEATYRYKYYE